jgi:hypothetical protein
MLLDKIYRFYKLDTSIIKEDFMIRHITSNENLIKIKKDGLIKPGGDGMFPPADKGYVSFEKSWKSDAMFKVLSILKGSGPFSPFSPGQLTAILFDEEQLLLKGYQIIDSESEVDLTDKKDLEDMVKKGELSDKEYGEIGNFVFLDGNVSLDYMIGVDFLDEERLKALGMA